MSANRDMRSMQLWPGGKSVIVSGDPHGDDLRVHADFQDKDGKPATPEERRAVRVETLAEMYVERDILSCDTALVADLMRLGQESIGDVANEFSYDNVTNLRPDPSDWTLEQCKEWLDDNGHDYPDPNPWGMDAEALLDLLDDEGREQLAAEHPNATVDEVRAWVVADMEQEVVSGLDAWRDAVRDNADDGEIYQWFRVASWLADKLSEIGEAVLDNGYGCWWGRQCCGQAVIMDGVFQRIAEKFVD